MADPLHKRLHAHLLATLERARDAADMNETIDLLTEAKRIHEALIEWDKAHLLLPP